MTFIGLYNSKEIYINIPVPILMYIYFIKLDCDIIRILI